MARKRRKRRAAFARSAPKARSRSVVGRRRSVARRGSPRRNPPALASLIGGAKDAAVGAGAQIAAGMIAAKLPNFIDPPSKGGAGKTGPQVNQLLAGFLVGFIARMALGADMGRAAMQGALQAPIVGYVGPIVNKATGGVPATVAAYPRSAFAAYPRQALASYPNGPRLLAGDPTSFGPGAAM